MVRIVVDNAVSHIAGNFHIDYEVSKIVSEETRNALAYEVPGAEWSAKYKAAEWDGKISLYSKRDKSFPTGLLFRVKNILNNNHIEYVIESKRIKPPSDSKITTTFAQYNRELRPYQSDVVAAALERGRGVLSVATGGGKALDVDTPMLTMNRGWLTMGDIKSGDVVFDNDGQPTDVLMAHSILLDEPCYQLRFSDGSQIVSNADHLWVVDSYYEGDQLTTEAIYNQMNEGFVFSIPRPLHVLEKKTADIIQQRLGNDLMIDAEISRVYIESITPCASRPVRCITVNSPKKMYLAGETLIPTHNTMISAELIARLNALPVVFIVPSKTLMYQTQKEFKKYLQIDGQPTHVGIAGDGTCDLNQNGINILTWQTALQAFDEKYTTKGDKVVYDEFTGLQIRKTKQQLIDDVQDATRALEQAVHNNTDIKEAKAKLRKAKTRLQNREQQLHNKQQIKDLMRKTPVFIVDEAHTAAVVIQRLGEHAAMSYYRFGVTATAWREDNQEIRIEGTFGRILINISPSDLIRLGWLVRPHIFMVNIKHLESASDYNDAYQKHIVNCWERNYRIKQFTEEMLARGRKVLILVERIEHGEILEQMVYNSVFVPGSDDGSGNEDITEEIENYRLEMLAKCGRGELALIATQWANVGVDEPNIDTLILAGSNKSSVTTFQQVGRILRTAPGKNNAVVIDFNDEHDDLHNHSLKRKRAYALEKEFKVYRVQ